MDLNFFILIFRDVSAGWLPRGAMDLNSKIWESTSRHYCWLPRGAMDLNTPSYKDSENPLSWLPRGAMDLNFNSHSITCDLSVGSLVEPWI